MLNLETNSFFSRFRKHYGHYLLGVIIPAVTNGLSIPVFKKMLGAAAYGRFALYFNALLITNLLISGWLSQAVLRFYAKATDKQLFSQQVFFLSVFAGSICFLPAVAVIWWQSQNILTGILFGAVLLLAAVQLPLQALTQSGFLSKAAVTAEAIRTLSWFGLSLLFLKTGWPFFPALFTALGVSYLLSIIFLCKKSKLLANMRLFTAGSLTIFKSVIRYGWPFSLWFMLYYFTSYIDKILMLQQHGPVVQGHYSALSDFLAKSIGMLFAPVVVAAVPLLSEAHETNRRNAVQALLKKLIFFETAALVFFTVLYLLFGYKLLFYLLHIPLGKSYVQAGMLILCGTMVWQIALLVHKPLELRMHSFSILTKMVIAASAQLLFYYLAKSYYGVLVYPAGYCLAALVYLLLVCASVFRESNIGKRTTALTITG